MNLFSSQKQSTNPAFNQKSFQSVPHGGFTQTMTANGAFEKAALLGLIALGTGATLWHFALIDPSLIKLGMIGGGIVGFILAIITIFSKKNSPILAPLYAAAEGVFLGGISLFMETIYPGIVVQAILLTSGVFFAMLVAYRSKLIQATARFKRVILGATAGIAVLYVVTFVLRLFGSSALGFLHESSPEGIIFSGIVVVIAALNLIIDFDFIDKAAASRAPKYMEWYGAFGLMITVVWLYIEILKLLAKLRGRD